MSFFGLNFKISAILNFQRSINLLKEMVVFYSDQIQVRKRPGGVCASLSEKDEYHSQRPPTPLLDTINYPIHMKNLSVKVQNYKHIYGYYNFISRGAYHGCIIDIKN